MTELDRKRDRAPVPAAWDYAPAPEARDLVELRDRYGLFVAGDWLEPTETYTTIDPSSEEPLAEVGQATAEEVDQAVGAAREAFDDGWSSISPSERAKYLFRIARILQERSREFAVLESMNGGKPIRESRDVDLPLAAAHFFYYAGWADKLEYAFPNRKPSPIGVAGQIVPWNFPLLMLSWKIAPALAAGNTVVLKPAETTPLSALLFADVLRQAELPPGVVNIVTGDGSTGAALVKHEGVDKIAFTGSTEVGKSIQRELAGTGKRLTLELGGKAANIIFDDAALDQAVEGIVNGIYFNQGHVCCAGSRLLVQESIYEPLIGKLKRRLQTLRVGDPLDKNTDVGAINSRQQLDKIKELVAAGEEEGAEIYQPPCRLPEKGYWFAPTVFTERRPELPHRAGGDLRPGALGAHLPHARRGGREGEQHAVRALGRCLDGEGLAHPGHGAAAARGCDLGEHVQPLRPGLAVRRLQGVRLRPRGRAPWARAVPGVRVTEAENKALIRRFYEEVWQRGNLGVADEVFADQYERHDFRTGEPTPGPEGQRQIAGEFRAAFPDLSWQIDFILADGEFVVGRWTASGTHLGAWAGVEATAKPMRFSGINVFRVSDGKVVEIWNHRDDLGLMQQLGAPVYAGAPE